MTRIYLFDWGDTLMVDIPGQAGKMCDWPEVKPVDGAAEALAHLSQSSTIYVATNAAESAPEDIERAFERAGLSSCISGYFCRANLGMGKNNPAYYQAILEQLEIPSCQATMIGDSFANDIEPALEAGLSAIWLNPGGGDETGRLRIIGHMRELCTLG